MDGFGKAHEIKPSQESLEVGGLPQGNWVVSLLAENERPGTKLVSVSEGEHLEVAFGFDDYTLYGIARVEGKVPRFRQLYLSARGFQRWTEIASDGALLSTVWPPAPTT